MLISCFFRIFTSISVINTLDLQIISLVRPSVHGFLQARIWSELPFPLPLGPTDPGIGITPLSQLLALQADSTTRHCKPFTI